MASIQKIGIITFDYDPIIGGQGIYVLNLIEALKKENIPFAVLSPQSNKLLKKIGKVGLGNKNLGPLLFSVYVHFIVKKWLRVNKITVAHTQAGAGGVFLLKKLRVPLITTSHMLYSYKKSVHGGIYKLLYLLEQRNFRISDTIIATSQHMQSMLCREYGIHENKIEIIPCGINTSLFAAKEQSQTHIPRKLLYVGRLHSTKNILELVNIFAELRKEYRDIYLTIIGTGPLYGQLIALIAHLNCSDSITIIQDVKNTELPYHFQNADLLVLPTSYESFGIVGIEALSCGTPIVITANSGLAESVTQYNAGKLFDGTIFDLRNAMAQALNYIFPLPDTLHKIVFQKYELQFVQKNILRIYSKIVT